MKQHEILSALKRGEYSPQRALQLLKASQSPSSDRVPLTEGQMGLWVLNQLNPGSTAYQIPLAFRLHAALDGEILRRAVDALLTQYPVLLTVIREEHGQPCQVAGADRGLVYRQADLSHLDDEGLLAHLRDLGKQPMSLQDGPLLTIHLFNCAQGQQVLLVVMHHIISDAQSAQLLMSSLSKAYRLLSRGEAPSWDHISVGYKAFVQWEKSFVDSDQGQAQLRYWAEKLAAPLPVLELPADRPRYASTRTRGFTCSVQVSADLSARLREVASGCAVTPAVLLLAAYKLLLARYAGQSELIVGMPVAGRPHAHFKELIGYFVNMVPVRCNLNDDAVFADFARDVQLAVVDALDNASFPFSAIVRELKVARSTDQSPVFQVAFEFQSQNVIAMDGMEKLDWGVGDAMVLMPGIHQEGEYELVLEVYERETGFVLNLKHDPELFDEDSIASMAQSYLTLLEGIAQSTAGKLAEYPLLGGLALERTIAAWNDTAFAEAVSQTLPELFEQQAHRTPEATALAFKDQRLTYGELLERTSTLARYLVSQGVKSDQLVGVFVDRSIDMVVAFLSILRAGGAYVPLDPEYPTQRLQYMLHNSDARCVLVQSKLVAQLTPLLPPGVRAIVIDEGRDDMALAVRSSEVVLRPVHERQLAYVIYTSGSTGNPKGVMIEHRALANFIASMAVQPGMSSADIMLAVTTYSFDIAGLEMYLPLAVGAQCRICDQATTRDADALAHEIERVGATVMQATPATWTMLLQAGWRNERHMKMLCGGEALPEVLKQQMVATGAQVWNMFGPTETTIWSTVSLMSELERVNIGRPIANTQVYVLDSRMQPQPVSVPGELHIGGDGVARGYLHLPDMTRDRFVDDPFRPGQKLYKTGDLARWNAQGQIEYLGRMDSQVKVRGYRIELGEIETRLRQLPGVQNCAVVVHDAAGHKQLVGYYVGQSSADGKALRVLLKECLPEYMVPSRLIGLPQLPMTPNGKVDRKSLAERTPGPSVAAKAPTTLPLAKQHQRARRLLRRWRELLAGGGCGA